MVLILAMPVRITAADTIDWVVATPFPGGSKPQTALVKAAKKLERASNGEVRVHFKGHEPDPELSLLNILAGDDSISAALLPYTELTALEPDAGLYGQFFVFAGFSEVNSVRRSLDRSFLMHAQSDDYAAVAILGLGFVHLMSDSRFVSVTDLAGQDVLVSLRSAVYDDFLRSMALNVRADASDSPPSLMLHSPAALILDKSIPRLKYIVSPPAHYAYLILVAKRSQWLGLPADRRAAMENMFVDELGRLEQDAERAAARASRVLSNQGMRGLPLGLEDLQTLRDAGTDHRISTGLQSQLQHALTELRQ